VLSDWDEWSICDHEDAQRYRHRSVARAPRNGGVCRRHLAETEGCPKLDSVDTQLTDWSAWSECDKTCEGGQKVRRRKVSMPSTPGGATSNASLKEVASCNIGPCDFESPRDCKFKEWTSWSECSAECGTGFKRRTRSVLEPADRGDGCEGSLVTVAECHGESPECTRQDCRWGNWTDWSACSCSCGGGHKRRSRRVEVHPAHGGAACSPEDKEEVAPCSTEPCGDGCVDGEWGEWMEWTDCSASCTGGFRSRQREVKVQPSECGKPVTGLREEFALCESLPPCANETDCQLSAWSSWSECSRACAGARERARRIVAFAAGGGAKCEGALHVIEPCNRKGEQCEDNLPVDCVVGDWGKWSKCSVSCGGGQRTRKRHVATPAARGGAPCEGNFFVVEPCNDHSCSGDCHDCRWSDWSEWGNCTVSGQKFRTRGVDKLPNHCGKPCEEGCAKEVASCTGGADGELFCAWSGWSETTLCAGSCGHASATRMRSLTVSKKPPKGGLVMAAPEGGACSGMQMNVSACPFTKSCTEECSPRDCRFADWSDWHQPSCSGLCERHRVIKKVNNLCGKPCDGALLETKQCPYTCDEPKDCLLSEWSDWTACSSDGPGGQRYRKRRVDQEPEREGKPCSGTLQEATGCGVTEARPCEFAEWGDWSNCSVECGDGWTERWRKIKGLADRGAARCEGGLKEVRPCRSWIKSCDETERVDCRLGEWSHWGECDSDGMRSRNRSIAEQAQNGGDGCRGGLAETEGCLSSDVDCEMSDWTRWEPCDRTCGEGQTVRERQVERFPAQGGKECPHSLIETRGCNSRACDEKDCEVSDWTGWSKCSAACGAGFQNRSRTVSRLRSLGGAGCGEALAESRACAGLPSCEVKDCEWGSWSDWSDCSHPCGGGQQGRDRLIATLPKNGGEACPPEDAEETRPCNRHGCQNVTCRDGEWGRWGAWAPCSVSCGGGTTFRSRKVKSMANECGSEPEGKDRETAFCNLQSCDKTADCELTQWTSWSGCDSACHGMRERSRRVKAYGSGDGAFCQGALVESVPCNPLVGEKAPAECQKELARDCQLGSWGAWSECSATCGGGERLRGRNITQRPVNGGAACEGPLKQVSECGRTKCKEPDPVDCRLGDWEDWGACGKCGGQRKRARSVKQYAENGGAGCDEFVGEETGECPRDCGEEMRCMWTSWGDWSACSADCGAGKRSRRRGLELTAVPTEELNASASRGAHRRGSRAPAGQTQLPASDVVAKYEALYASTLAQEHGHARELAAAFAGGFGSLLVLAAGLRSACAPRRVRGLGSEAPQEWAPPRGHAPVAQAEDE